MPPLKQGERPIPPASFPGPARSTVVIPKEETPPAGEARKKGLVYGGLAAGLVAVILVIALFAGRGTESAKDKAILEKTKGPHDDRDRLPAPFRK